MPFDFSNVGYIGALKRLTVGGWKELGRTTAGSEVDTITVSSLANKRYLMILRSLHLTGTVTAGGRFNSDTAGNYANRWSDNGGADSTGTSQTSMVDYAPIGTNNEFTVHHVANLSTKEKLQIEHSINQNTAGAGTAPQRREASNKWANTTDAISSYSAVNTDSGGMATGSEVVVLGWNPADTHTDNFWTELASVNGDGSTATIDSGVIAAKKYIWLQWFAVGVSSGANAYLELNSDTSANYTTRYSQNGAGDGTLINRTEGLFTRVGVSGETNIFTNAFIVNVSSKEKLCISHTITQQTAGAGNVPSREEDVSKWINTSSQITRIKAKMSSGTQGTSSILKIWGSD